MESLKHRAPVARAWSALRFALDGFSAALRHRGVLRQEVFAALVLAPIAVLLPVPGTGKALMIASVLLLLIVTLINSAIEAALDRIALDNHRLARRARDIGSAAMFVALLNAVLVWLLVLIG
jgi:diacylglycerol kinase (ATP)